MTLRRYRTDVVLVVIIGLVAAVVGYRESAARFQCQNCVADLLFPCVRQLGYMPSPEALAAVPDYQAFRKEKRTSIACHSISGLPTVRIGQYWDIQKYMHWSQSAMMLLTGPRFEGFWLFLALMYSLSAAAAYFLCRLGMGQVIAAAAALAWVFAPLHLGNLMTPADYAKAPFAIATLALIGLMVKRPMPLRNLLACAAAAGVSAGIGTGFKPDVMVYALLAIPAVALFAAPAVDGRRWSRLWATAVFVASFLIASGPVLVSHAATGSLFPIQVLGGMAPGHDETHAAPAIYDYGLIWDDSWVTFQINSYNQRVNGATGYANLMDPELARAGRDLLVHFYSLFPADLLLRIAGAVIRILDLVPLALAAAAVLIVALYTLHLRWALFVTFVLIGFVGYTSLVFQPRHYFHLQIVSIWMLGAVVHHAAIITVNAMRRRPTILSAFDWRRARAGLAALGTLAALSLLTLMGARAYQSARLTAIIEDYNRDYFIAPVAAERRTAGPWSQLVVDWPNHVPSEGPAALALRSTYLVVGVRCLGTEDAMVWRTYRSPDYWRHGFPVNCSEDAGEWRVFMPIYESGPSWRFHAVEWAANDAIDVALLGKVAGLGRTPLLLSLRLPESWRERPLYHRLSWDAIRTPRR